MKIATFDVDPQIMLQAVLALQMMGDIPVIMAIRDKGIIITGRVLACHDGLNRITLEIEGEQKL